MDLNLNTVSPPIHRRPPPADLVQTMLYVYEPVSVGVALCVPDTPGVSLRLPVAVHAAGFVEGQVIVALCASMMIAGETKMVGAGVAGGVWD
jgi:hypothetical protein